MGGVDINQIISIGILIAMCLNGTNQDMYSAIEKSIQKPAMIGESVMNENSDVAYKVTLHGEPLLEKDALLAAEIFLSYLPEDAWHQELSEFEPQIEGTYDDTWWNPIIDKRKCYEFVLQRPSDNYYAKIAFYSSPYSEDEFDFTDMELESLKGLIYKYLYPLPNVKDGNVLLSLDAAEQTILLSEEESSLIKTAYQNAWFDGEAYYMSGADYTPDEQRMYVFRCEENNELLFSYSELKQAIPNSTYYNGEYMSFLSDNEKQVEQIIQKYFGESAFPNNY